MTLPTGGHIPPPVNMRRGQGCLLFLTRQERRSAQHCGDVLSPFMLRPIQGDQMSWGAGLSGLKSGQTGHPGQILISLFFHQETTDYILQCKPYLIFIIHIYVYAYI